MPEGVGGSVSLGPRRHSIQNWGTGVTCQRPPESWPGTS
jgi:hypothetical protein